MIDQRDWCGPGEIETHGSKLTICWVAFRKGVYASVVSQAIESPAQSTIET